jgi:hypothetical protein
MLVAMFEIALPLILLLALLAALWHWHHARMAAAERRIERIDDPAIAMALLDEATRQEKEISDRLSKWNSGSL